MDKNFFNRVKSLPWVTEGAAPDGITPVLALNNQLLVDAERDAAVRAALPDGLQLELLTTLLHNLPDGPPRCGDVNVYVVTGDDQQHRFRERDGIFWLTGVLRSQLDGTAGDGAPLSAVSPNHILIPAPAIGNGCPHGAPFPADGQAWELHSDGYPVQITVIDSGWQWDDDNWGQNPLRGVQVEQAERLPLLAEVAADGGAPAPWKDGDPDPPGGFVCDELGAPLRWDNDPTKQRLEPSPGAPQLLALTGHANFIAGVIAARCNARLTVVNHNASFLQNQRRAATARAGAPGYDPSADPLCYEFPTEVAVARSLCKVMGPPGADMRPHVINIGFSFLPWSRGLTDGTMNLPRDDEVSAVWARAFEYIRRHKTMIVAPAGNQRSPYRHYPAALAKKTPNGQTPFANVIGVGSMDDLNSRFAQAGYVRPTPFPFTNYGTTGDEWVTCAAFGNEVVSTFPHVNMAVEDSDDGFPRDFTASNLAVWNGTSFSTPKVVGGIGKLVSEQVAAGDNPDPPLAWQTLRAGTTAAPSENELDAAGAATISTFIGIGLPDLG